MTDEIGHVVNRSSTVNSAVIATQMSDLLLLCGGITAAIVFAIAVLYFYCARPCVNSILRYGIFPEIADQTNQPLVDPGITRRGGAAS